MGYTAAIGQRETYEDGGCWVVCIEYMAAAPLDSSSMDIAYAGRGNYCAPSYTAWHEFLQRVGLYDLWCGDEGPYGPRDEAQPITRDVLEYVDEALAGHGGGGGIDGRRLTWMHWWMHWAFDNCDDPVFG